MDAIPLDNSTLVVIVLAVIVIVVAFFFRQRIRLSIRGPNKTGMNLEASNQPPSEMPDHSLAETKSRDGGLKLKYKTNGTTDFRRLDAKKDVEITVTQPSEPPLSGKKPKKP